MELSKENIQEIERLKNKYGIEEVNEKYAWVHKHIKLLESGIPPQDIQELDNGYLIRNKFIVAGQPQDSYDLGAANFALDLLSELGDINEIK